MKFSKITVGLVLATALAFGSMNAFAINRPLHRYESFYRENTGWGAHCSQNHAVSFTENETHCRENRTDYSTSKNWNGGRCWNDSRCADEECWNQEYCDSYGWQNEKSFYGPERNNCHESGHRRTHHSMHCGY